MNLMYKHNIYLFRFEKNKWISTVPSKTNDYNKFIIKNEHKMVIL